MRLVKCRKEHYGRLTKGCQQCIKGRKSVLFLTGRCHYDCFYCPISDDKRNKDIVKINERVIEFPDKPEGLAVLFEEIRLCKSLGVGITGGDPLAKPDRAFTYIKALKKEFGKKFHIHLYTSLQYVSKEKLLHLNSIGLDEIRFHLDVDNDKLWKKILFANKMNFFVGVEIPAIPGKLEQTKKLMDYCQENKIQFLNLNELEYSDISDLRMTQLGFTVKNELSYGIAGSEELALQLVAYGKKIGLPTHYCSAGFKDGVQLANRLLLRASSVAYKFDEVDKQGMLTRGEIKAKQGVGLKEVDLDKIANDLLSCGFRSKDFVVQQDRIVLSAKKLEAFMNSQKVCDWQHVATASIVKEYPTHDHFLLERSPLS